MHHGADPGDFLRLRGDGGAPTIGLPVGRGHVSDADQETRTAGGGGGGASHRAPRVLISYRRADTRGYAGWIYQWLCERFGKENVFKDIDTIKLGQDWRKVIQSEVAQCDALIALIGPRWLDATDDHGRRLHDDGDVLRAEIEHALQRDIPVVPVLVDDAAMPRARDLPESLSSLPDRQALRLSELHLDQDMDALADDLEQAILERAEQDAGPTLVDRDDPVIVLPPSPLVEPSRSAPPPAPVVPPLGTEASRTPLQPPAPASPVPGGAPARSRRGVVIGVAAVMVLLAGIVAAIVTGSTSEPTGQDQRPSASVTPEPTSSPSTPPVTQVDTFASGRSIEIPASGTEGPAEPYPSEIPVSGLDGTIVDIEVTIHGLTHSYADDVDVLLVGPGGDAVVLLADAGNGREPADVVLTFDDDAGSAFGQGPIASGSYRPSGETPGEFDGSLPAPRGPYAEALGDFVGADPNGTWSLFVFDDAGADSGRISGGWSLEITTSA
jgi:hypothetical protein